MSYNNHIIENITGISYGTTGIGIEIANAMTGFKMSNLVGYNLSPTGSSGAYGIYAYATQSSPNDVTDSAILIDSVGRSFKGNGIYANNLELKKCIGYASYSDDSEVNSFFAFTISGNVILDECSSDLGASVGAASLLLKDDGYGGIIKINGCNLVGKSAPFVISYSFPNINRKYDIRIKNSVLESSSTTGRCISAGDGSYKNLEIDNCEIKGFNGIVVGSNTSINNNLIEVKNPASYGISSNETEARVSFSNNTIIGATSANGGVSSNIYQGIPPQTVIDSYGNISYSKIDTTGLVLYLDSGRSNSYPGSGTSLFDIAPNTSNTATLSGALYSPLVPGGSNGGSHFFDGTDFGTIAYSSSLALNTAITIEAFVRPSSFASEPNIINYYSNQGYRLRFTNAGFPEFISNNASINFVANTAVSLNQWTHVAIAFGSTGGTMYVNGVAAGTTTTPYAAIILAGQAIYIGQFTGGTERFNGYFGAIRVYNRRLNFREIRKNFLADRSRYGIADPN